MATVAFPLLELPLELRRLVYYHYFFRDGIVCQIRDVPLSHVKPLKKQQACEQHMQVTSPSSFQKIQANLRSNIDAMPLLLACHQM